MKIRKVVIGVACLWILFLGVCNAQETADELRQRMKMELRDIPKITAGEALELYRQGKLHIIDTSPPNRYKEHHCLGAINIPDELGLTGKFELNAPKATTMALY